MSEKQYSDNPIMNDIFADTASRLKPRSTESDIAILPMPDDTGKSGRWKDIAFGNCPGVSELASRIQPEPPPFSVPIKNTKDTVEVAPGILVSEHLIRDAVSRTSAGDTAQDHQDYYQQRKEREKKLFEEVKEDLKISRQVIQSMVDRVRNPPNMKEKYVSFDAMPTPLQRVVQAYISAAEANKELDEAIKALQGSSPPVAEPVKA